MSTVLWGQCRQLLLAVGMGIAFGWLYDVVGVLGRRSRFLYSLLTVFYLLFFSAAVFYGGEASGSGLRWHFLVGVGGGMAAYYMLSRNVWRECKGRIRHFLRRKSRE